MMRSAYVVFTSVLGLLGCSATSAGPDSQSPMTRIVTYHHYAQSAGLQYNITNRPEHTLLDKDGEEVVLKLAHAQNCLASLTKSPDLARETLAMLDSYVEFHEHNESQPSAAFTRRARRARIDAEATRQGTTSSYFLGCNIRPPTRRTPNRTGAPAGSANRRGGSTDSYNTGPPWTQASPSVAGGVIR